MRNGLVILLVLLGLLAVPGIAAACGEPGNVDIDGPSRVPYGKATNVGVLVPTGGTVTYEGANGGHVANPFEDVITLEQADQDSDGWFTVQVEAEKGDDPGLLTVSDGVGCATLTMTPVRGARPKLAVAKTNSGTVTISLHGRRDCNALEATKASVLITWLPINRPRVTQRFSYDDICSEPDTTGRRHAYRTDLREPGELTLKLAKLPARPTSRGWVYVVRMNGRLAKRGLIWQSVTRVGRPDRVIWQGTDDFWNICVNEGRPVNMQDGRLYCWDFGWSKLVRRVELLPYYPGD